MPSIARNYIGAWKDRVDNYCGEITETPISPEFKRTFNGVTYDYVVIFPTCEDYNDFLFAYDDLMLEQVFNKNGDKTTAYFKVYSKMPSVNDVESWRDIFSEYEGKIKYSPQDDKELRKLYNKVLDYVVIFPSYEKYKNFFNDYNEALVSSYDNHDDEYDSDSECLVHINIKQE